MKTTFLRAISLCLLCAALLTLGGCNFPFLPTEPTEPTEPPVVLERQTVKIFDNTETYFRTIGRTYQRDNGLACDNSCTGIEFTALCEGNIYLNVTASAQAFLTVYIDGERSEERVSVNPNLPLVTIAEDLEQGEHTIMVVSQTQFALATMVMHDVVLTGELLDKPADRDLFIEFYGDSTLHGSNVYKGGTSAVSSDSTNAFGWIAAQQLGADCTLIGRGGLGLVKSNGFSYSMMDLYDLCGGINIKNVPKYDFARQPDVVVLKLGANDYRNADLVADPSKFADGVKQFIGIIREKYGAEVPIVWVYGNNDNGMDFWNVTEATMESLKAAGDTELYACKVSVSYCPKSEGGDGLHPDVKRAKVMGQEVADFLSELLK